MIAPKADYSIPEAAVALGRSTEFVRQRLAKQPDRRERNTRLTHAVLMQIALPGLSVANPTMRDGVNYYTKAEVLAMLEDTL